MGKSASGKDTLYKRILEQMPNLGTVVLYTTRPVRAGETEGIEYHFTTPARLEEFQKQGKMIELRTYQTIFGPWSYATVDDGQIDLRRADYLVIGTLESYRNMLAYFGEHVMVPLYIYVDDGIRLTRAIQREGQQPEPKYTELCRRFLADDEDFSEEKLKQAGITRRYDNENLEHCLEQICQVISRPGE